MEEGLWIPITAFVVIGLVIFVITFFRYKSRLATQKTIRLALEKGNEMTPELLTSLIEPKHSVSGDLRRGLVSLSIGVGIGLFGYILGEDDAVRPMIGMSMFPVFIGIAYLILWRLGQREKQS
jgi:hypothetical protein